MKETFYKTGNYKADHTKFGGIIFPSDYDTNHAVNRNIASRIERDWRFDEQCEKSARARNIRNVREKEGETDYEI